MAITHSPFLMLPLILFFLLRLSPISATELSSPPLLPPLPKALLAFAEPPGALPQPAPSSSSCVSGIHPLLTNLTHLFLHFIQLLSKCLPHFSLFLPKKYSVTFYFSLDRISSSLHAQHDQARLATAGSYHSPVPSFLRPIM